MPFKEQTLQTQSKHQLARVVQLLLCWARLLPKA
jgi:hypothetical protein